MKVEGGDDSTMVGKAAMVGKASQPWKRKHDEESFTGCSMMMVREEEEGKMQWLLHGDGEGRRGRKRHGDNEGRGRKRHDDGEGRR